MNAISSKTTGLILTNDGLKEPWIDGKVLVEKKIKKVEEKILIQKKTIWPLFLKVLLDEIFILWDVYFWRFSYSKSPINSEWVRLLVCT